MTEHPTIKLEGFGHYQLLEVKDILTSICDDGYPNQFYEDGIEICLNPRSGYIYLQNSDYQCCMMNDGRLEMHYHTPYEGHEGFAEELKEMFECDGEDWNKDDVEFLKWNNIITEEEFEQWEAERNGENDEDESDSEE